MLFHNSLGLMPLSTTSCSWFPFAPLFEVSEWTPPSVSSPSSWRVVSSSRRYFYSTASTWFSIGLKCFVLVWISSRAFFCCLRRWLCSSVWRLCLNIWYFLFCCWLCFCFGSYHHDVPLSLLNCVNRVLKVMNSLMNIFGLLQGLFYNKILEL